MSLGAIERGDGYAVASRIAQLESKINNLNTIITRLIKNNTVISADTAGTLDEVLAAGNVSTRSATVGDLNVTKASGEAQIDITGVAAAGAVAGSIDFKQGTTTIGKIEGYYDSGVLGGLRFHAVDDAGALNPIMELARLGLSSIGDIATARLNFPSNLALMPLGAWPALTIVHPSATAAVSTSPSDIMVEVYDAGGRETLLIDGEGFLSGPERASGFSEPLVFVGYSGSDSDALNFDPSFLFRQDTGRGADFFMAFSVAATHAAWRAGTVAFMDNNGNLFKGRPESSFDAARITYLQSNNDIQTGPDAHYIDFWSYDAVPPIAPVQDVDANCRLFVKEDTENVDKLWYYDGNGEQILIGGVTGTPSQASTSTGGDLTGTASNTLQTAKYTPAGHNKIVEADNQILIYGDYTIRAGASLALIGDLVAL